MSITEENAKANEFANYVSELPDSTAEILISLFNEVVGRIDKIDQEEYEKLKIKLYDNSNFQVPHDLQEEVEYVFQIIIDFDTIHRTRG
jgi:hypothetical protein